VGDLLLEVGGRQVLNKPVDKIKKYILGEPGSSSEFLFKRWTHDDESVMYSITLVRKVAITNDDAPADGASSIIFTNHPHQFFSACREGSFFLRFSAHIIFVCAPMRRT